MLPDPVVFAAALSLSEAHHKHLCPRQVLGVRLGLYALHLLGYPTDQPFDNARKRLLTIAETDGCGTDGISAALDCSVGHRTLRIEDCGKLAAAVIDVAANRAVRVRPHPEARERALDYPLEAKSRWHHYLYAYQAMPDEALFEGQAIRLHTPIAAIVSKPGARVTCSECREEIMNEREIWKGDQPYCKTCARQSYYAVLQQINACG